MLSFKQFLLEISRAEKREIKQRGAELIHSDGNVTVHKITTPEASSLYCSGTKWCTKKPEDFKEYSERGPLYVLQRKKKDGGVEKYQFHIQNNEMRDAENNNTDFRSLPEEVSKSLAKSDNPIIHHAMIAFNSRHVTERHITSSLKTETNVTPPTPPIVPIKALSNYPHLINTKHINTAMKHPLPPVVETAIMYNPHLINKEHIEMAEKHPDKGVREVISYWKAEREN